ncbi:hypothetical protein [Salinithrix halophila]|uniref:Uncharacterized protein n=1 Tax=Salinithrix halophila TaxID=1485204 RepID=A0ABV8J8M7_9BACL
MGQDKRLEELEERLERLMREREMVQENLAKAEQRQMEQEKGGIFINGERVEHDPNEPFILGDNVIINNHNEATINNGEVTNIRGSQVNHIFRENGEVERSIVNFGNYAAGEGTVNISSGSNRDEIQLYHRILNGIDGEIAEVKEQMAEVKQEGEAHKEQGRRDLHKEAITERIDEIETHVNRLHRQLEHSEKVESGEIPSRGYVEPAAAIRTKIAQFEGEVGRLKGELEGLEAQGRVADHPQEEKPFEQAVEEMKKELKALDGLPQDERREKAMEIILDNPRVFQQIEALAKDAEKNGIVVEADLKGGAYVRQKDDRTNLGYVPWTKDEQGLNRIDGDKIQWNKNQKINLSIQQDDKGKQYIKLESKDKGVTARAYTNGEAKPFPELKNSWEVEGKTWTQQKNRDQGIDRERGMER